MDLIEIVNRIKNRDVDAFTLLVKQYQNLAFAYAFAILKDFHRAQDVTQEAFLVAYYQISQLKEPEAFLSWLKGIVRNQCYRQLRRKSNAWVPIYLVDEKADEEFRQPDYELGEKEQKLAVLHAINSLPELQREVVSLFYMEENSQQDVAVFLEISVSDVNNCLHAARKTLKKRMNHMVDQTFKSNALPEDFADSIGKIIKVQGRLIDVEVAPSFSPSLFDDFKTNKKGDSKLTVVQRLKNGRVRCLVSGDITQLKTNTQIKNESENSFPSWNESSIKEAVQSIGTSIQGKLEIFETGIKIIDLLCPFPKNGNVGMVGGIGVGRVAVVAEMYRRFLKEDGKLSIFFLVTPIDATNIRAMLEYEPDLTSDEGGPFQTAWLITPNAAEPDFAKESDYLDACPFFSPVMAVQRRWPAIDPLRSASKLLDSSLAGEDHYNTAQQVLDVLAKEEALMKDPVFFEYLAMGSKLKAQERSRKFEQERFADLSTTEHTLVSRARKLKNFFTQPFFVAEEYTKIKGTSVSLQETIKVCKTILSGGMDDLPETAFLYVGGEESIWEKARKS